MQAMDSTMMMVEKMAAGTEETAASAEEQTASMQELSSKAQTLATLADKLSQAVSRFKTEEDSGEEPFSVAAHMEPRRPLTTPAVNDGGKD